MNAGGRLLGDAADVLGEMREPAGFFFQRARDQRKERFLLLVCGMTEEIRVTALGFRAQMDQERSVPAIIEDHVRRPAVAPFEDAPRELPILFERLALVGEDGRA